MPKVIRPSWPNNTPQQVRIAIVGEAPGADEEWLGAPFVGQSGQELTSMLRDAGIDRNDCLLTNVISTRPPNNNLAAYCLRKEDLPHDYPAGMAPIVTMGGNYYLHPEHFGEGARLREELAVANPNVVIALGATACWALLGSTAVGNLRGVVHPSVTSAPYKVLPTWHPAAVMRQWKWRPVAVADMIKARLESDTPTIRYDNVELWIEPTLDDLYAFERQFMAGPHLDSVDVETRAGEIVCVGFAPDTAHAIVVPFRLDHGTGRPLGNYWSDFYSEKQAWLWVKRQVERHEIVGQNFLYDTQYFLKYGINPRRIRHDTMLAHHSLYPELRKDLGFLGSIYTNHPSWKKLAGHHADELKKDA